MTHNTKMDSALPPEDIDEEVLRKRLVNRIAIAGVVIVALLGGLAVIDSLYVTTPSPSPKIATPTPLPTEIAKPADVVDAVSATAASTLPEPPQPEAVPTIKSQAEPEESSSPSVPLPKEPKSVAKITEPHPLSAKSEPGTHAATPRPLTQPKSASQNEPRFVLQMGVFNNVDNAQELLAKLQKNGIPAQIEARVQVGPFKTKAEADDARTKLKAMGLDAVLLMATHR